MINDVVRFSRDAVIFVVGNATIDETFVLPLLPKAGESVIGRLCTQDIGGKGANVATITARCGLLTRLTTVVGKDDRGRVITDALLAEPLELDVVVSETHGSDVSVICSAQDGENTIVSTVQAVHSLSHEKALQAVGSLQQQDVLVLHANLTESLTMKLIGYANRVGAYVVFNPSPFAPWVKKVIKDVDVVFINSGEGYQLTGKHGDEAVTALLNQGPKQIVLTCGKSGAVLGSCKAGAVGVVITDLNHVASVASSVCDTTGAGDTYLAVALASACLRECCLDTRALEHAAKASAITIARYGAFSALPDASTLEGILFEPSLD